MQTQHLRILFFGFFRQYANQRLIWLGFLDTPRSLDSSFDLGSTCELLSLPTESLQEMEREKIGEIKLFGENSLLVSDAKFIWLDQDTQLADIFLTSQEFVFFDNMFRDFLSTSNLIPLDSSSPSQLPQNFSIEDYISAFPTSRFKTTGPPIS